MKHIGNLEITKSNAQNYKDLVEVTGHLSINSNAELKALKSVGGNLYIYSNVEFEAPKLESVRGYLSINSNAEFEAPKLESVGGDLYIYCNVELKALKSVGGYLSISSNAELKAPKLKSVGGYLSINPNAELKAPKLKSVGGDLSIYCNVELKALKSVGGNLSIYFNAELKALKSVGGNLYIYSNAIEQFPNNVKIKCLRQICGNIGRMKFELIDDIACTVLSTKSKDGLTLKRCRKSVFRDGGLIGDAFFVASNDKNNAHGKTMKEAIDELHFKEMSRDVKKYRGMALTTKKSPQDWGLIYRAITGACNYGTKMFMEERKLKKTYTLEEILKETQGAYGSDKFKEVINS